MMGGELALPRKLSDYLAEYEEKKAALAEALARFEQAGRDLEMASCIAGTHGQGRIDVGRNSIHELERNLCRSAWLTLYHIPGVKRVMPAKDQKRFEAFVHTAPPFTVENIEANLGGYIQDPRYNILRGLAEVFGSLDQSFKSHERCKVGVKGLPKRIIITGFNGYSEYGWRKLRDVINAIGAYRNEGLLTEWQLRQFLESDGKHYLEGRGFELRLFGNGNGHVHFSESTLEDVNRALAEFYGDVLPDTHSPKPGERQASTAVSKDLQYYPTPKAVVEHVLSDIYIREPELILEPSCGCGRIMEGILNRWPRCIVNGIEVDPARAKMAREKGYPVWCENFLEHAPSRIYDRVIMNPPFYGRHYAKHVDHAMNFLKPGGTLHAILPVTARTDHGLIKGMGYQYSWSDLPVGSFRESGTNINTAVLKMTNHP